MYHLLILITLLPAFGQLLRFEFGQSGGAFMLHDIIIAMLIAYFVVYCISFKRKWEFGKLGKALIAIWTVMILSLTLGSLELLPNELIISSLYLFRFICYSALYFVVINQVKSKKKQTILLLALLASGILTAIFGFLQLELYPNFDKLRLYEEGWDPHINRLTSTWLDPNFVGGYFASIILVLTALTVHFVEKKKWKTTGFISAAIILLLVALMLTYSRSSYLAFFCGLMILGVIRLRKFIPIMILAVIILFSSSERLQERVNNAYMSFKAVVSDSTYVLDPTARLRIESWKRGWNIVSESPLLGVGFNTLRFKKMHEGYVPLTHHAASGFDSSILTIATTTGSLGLIAFLVFVTQLMVLLKKKYQEHTSLTHYLSLGFLSVCGALFVHSFFVNSLFYAFILIPLCISIGIIENMSSKKNP